MQAPGRLPIDFAALGADTLVLSAHKLGGPRGVGALIVRDGVDLAALIKGGGQERRRRGGTENVAGIAGFGAAAAAVAREADAVERMAALRDKLEDGVVRGDAGRRHRRPRGRAHRQHLVHRAAGQAGRDARHRLDLAGMAVSAGAACSSGKVGASHVLEAMGLGAEIARSAIRVSLGPQTTKTTSPRSWRLGRRLQAARRSPRELDELRT